MPRDKNYPISNWLYNKGFFVRFYERMAGRFSAEYFWNDLLARFLERVPKNAALLEIGAGPGLMAAKILKHRPDVRIIVTDYSPKMLELARTNVAKVAPGRAEFIRANAMDLSQFADQTIDGIYSLGAVKHFPDPLKGMLQAKRVLADGGIMYFADSCTDGAFAGIRKIMKQIKLSPILGIFLGPIIYCALKRESPCVSTIKSWPPAFGSYGTLDVQFSSDNSIFTLIYQNKERCEADVDMPARIGCNDT